MKSQVTSYWVASIIHCKYMYTHSPSNHFTCFYVPRTTSWTHSVHPLSTKFISTFLVEGSPTIDTIFNENWNYIKFVLLKNKARGVTVEFFSEQL